MTTENSKHRLAPIPDNRRLMVDKIHEAFLIDFHSQAKSVLCKWTMEIEKCLSDKRPDPFGVGIRAQQMTLMLLDALTEDSYKEGNTVFNVERVREIADVTRQSINLLRHHLGSELAGYQHNACEAKGNLLVWALLLRAAPSEANWLGRHLFNWYRAGRMDSDLLDPMFCDLMYLLVKSSVEGRWVQPTENDRLGLYASLYEHTNNPESFSAAVFSVCDFRLARAWGYDRFAEDARVWDMDDGPDEKMLGLYFSMGWMALFPIELLAFQSVYEQVTGHKLSFDCDHPLLEVGMLSVPDITSEPISDLGQRLNEYGRRCLGVRWCPDEQVALLPEKAENGSE